MSRTDRPTDGRLTALADQLITGRINIEGYTPNGEMRHLAYLEAWAYLNPEPADHSEPIGSVMAAARRYGQKRDLLAAATRGTKPLLDEWAMLIAVTAERFLTGELRSVQYAHLPAPWEDSDRRYEAYIEAFYHLIGRDWLTPYSVKVAARRYADKGTLR